MLDGGGLPTAEGGVAEDLLQHAGLWANHANTARDYLTMRGMLTARITTEGRGSYEPVVDNDNKGEGSWV